MFLLQRYKRYLNTLWSLLSADWVGYRQNIIGACIDAAILSFLLVFITAYVYPYMGMEAAYGTFYAISTFVSCGIFEMWAFTANFVSDKTGNKTILSQCLLPVPTWMIFAKMMVSFATRSICLSMTSIITSKLLLGSQLPLLPLFTGKGIVLFLAIQLFSGAFALFMASLVPNMDRISMVWIRVLFPLYFLGGSQFSYQTFARVFPKVSSIFLLNPLLYLFEGMNGVFWGCDKFLSFWVCLPVIAICGVIFGTIGVIRIMKQLDLVF